MASEELHLQAPKTHNHNLKELAGSGQSDAVKPGSTSLGQNHLNDMIFFLSKIILFTEYFIFSVSQMHSSNHSPANKSALNHYQAFSMARVEYILKCEKCSPKLRL